MYTPIQLEAIKLFGRKDLEFGCIVSQGGDEYQVFNFSDRFKNARYWDNEEEEAMMIMNGGYKILGHIPHLEDLFRVAIKNGLSIELWKESQYYLCFSQYKRIPYNPTIPLLDQPILEEILNLFK